MLGAALGTTPSVYACSGAVAANITSSTQYPGEQTNQLRRPGVDATASLLTLTIGGNDAGFSSVLQSCITQKLKADVTNAAVGTVGRWLGLGSDPSCAHSALFVASTNTQVDGVAAKVQDAYTQIAAKVDPVNTSIIAADYPKLFPNSTAEQDCVQLAPYLTRDDQNFVNTAGDRLDDKLRQAAGNAGVNFIDVRSAFAGHAVCGKAGTYINGLSVASGNGGSCTFSLLGQCVNTGLPIVGSFHPNAAGHANGYASAFQTLIDGASTRTPAGFPIDPGPPIGPHARLAAARAYTGGGQAPSMATGGAAATAGTPAVEVAALGAQPVIAGDASCEGKVQAGQLLQLTGNGFAPNTAVRIFVSSPGLAAAAEQQVGQAVADGTGTIALTVRVPLAAKGFTPAGATAGLISLDALGTGAKAAHQDDLTLVGLAPHGSACGTVDTCRSRASRRRSRTRRR